MAFYFDTISVERVLSLKYSVLRCGAPKILAIVEY